MKTTLQISDSKSVFKSVFYQYKDRLKGCRECYNTFIESYIIHTFWYNPLWILSTSIAANFRE